MIFNKFLETFSYMFLKFIVPVEHIKNFKTSRTCRQLSQVSSMEYLLLVNTKRYVEGVSYNLQILHTLPRKTKYAIFVLEI